MKKLQPIFNPDNLESPGPGYRFMRLGELIPNKFDYWYKGEWQHQSLPSTRPVYLSLGCTCTRRLPL